MGVVEWGVVVGRVAARSLRGRVKWDGACMALLSESAEHCRLTPDAVLTFALWA